MSERERFEAWARGLAPEPLPLRKDPSGNYWSEETDTAWDAWQAALADRPEQPVPMLGFEKWAEENGFNPASDKAWRKWTEIHTAPVARPEPVQLVAPPEYFTSIQESRQWTQCGPVAWHVSFNKGQTWTVYEYDPTGKVVGDPIVMPLVYAAQPSHPAPSKAGAVDLSYWCPFKDSACGDDPAKRCADCAQPAKGDAS